MSPSFRDKASIDLMYFQKSDTTILWMFFFVSKEAKTIFAWKTVIIMLRTSHHFELNRGFFIEDWNLRIFSGVNFSFFNLYSFYYSQEV